MAEDDCQSRWASTMTDTQNPALNMKYRSDPLDSQALGLERIFDSLGSVFSAATYQQLLDRCLDWLMEVLPFDGAAILVSDRSLTMLQGYSGRGIFDSAKIADSFHFHFLPDGADQSQASYLAAEALKAFSSPVIYGRPSGADTSQFGSPLVRTSQGMAFVVTDVQQWVDAGLLSVLDVYSENSQVTQVKQFFAFPLTSRQLYGDSNTDVFGLIIFNNLSEKLDLPLVISSGLRATNVVSLIIHDARISYQVDKAREISGRLRTTIQSFSLDDASQMGENAQERAAKEISRSLTALFRADFGVLVRRDGTGAPRLDSLELDGQSETLPDTAEIMRHLEQLEGRRALVLNRRGLSDSVLLVRLWADTLGRDSITLVLRRKNVKGQEQGGQFFARFIAEDGEVADLVAGEVEQWLSLILEVQKASEGRRRLWNELAGKQIHKLKNPVLVAKMAIEDVAEVSPGRIKRRLLPIAGEMDRLFDAIQGTLKFASADAVSLSSVDVNELIRKALIEALGNVGERERSRVSVSIQPGLGTIWADERRMASALAELVRNALKHSSDHRAQLSVFDGRDEVVFEIRNRGEIPPELRAGRRLFEPFVSGSSSGSGVGLAYVDEVVRGHRGKVADVLSSKSEGTLFRVSLPKRSMGS